MIMPAAASPLDSFLYLEWKRHGRHLEEYASECLGTAFMVFCVVGVVALMFAPGSPVPAWLPSTRLRLLFAGLMLGGSGWIVAISPPGRLSGAHINPAISLGFWLLGKMHFPDLLGYVVGQLFGGLLGAWGGQIVFHQIGGQVHYAALRPGPAVDAVENFIAEAAATFVLALVIYIFVSHRCLMRWTPAVATVVVGILVCLDGNYSGCGMNPARWLGPAAITASWADLPAYCVAPLLGAALASLPHHLGLLATRIPHTAKLYHDPKYRSVFKHDRVPTSPPRQLA